MPGNTLPVSTAQSPSIASEYPGCHIVNGKRWDANRHSFDSKFVKDLVSEYELDGPDDFPDILVMPSEDGSAQLWFVNVASGQPLSFTVSVHDTNKFECVYDEFASAKDDDQRSEQKSAAFTGHRAGDSTCGEPTSSDGSDDCVTFIAQLPSRTMVYVCTIQSSTHSINDVRIEQDLQPIEDKQKADTHDESKDEKSESSTVVFETSPLDITSVDPEKQPAFTAAATLPV